MEIAIEIPKKVVENNENRRQNALNAMRQLRGSGNGNLMKRLEIERSKERQNG